MIRLRSLSFWALLLTLALPSFLRAQNEMVHEKPLRLRHLSGVIVDQKGLFIPYPAVELRDANDHHVIATTFADGNGRFSFADRKPGERLEIRFTRKGYQPVQYTIDLARIGHETMKAVMPAAV